MPEVDQRGHLTEGLGVKVSLQQVPHLGGPIGELRNREAGALTLKCEDVTGHRLDHAILVTIRHPAVPDRMNRFSLLIVERNRSDVALSPHTLDGPLRRALLRAAR